MTVSTASMPGVSQASSQTNPFAQARSNVMTAVASKLGLPAGTDISAMTSRMAGHHRHHHSSATSTAASSDSSSLSSTDITALTDSTGSTTSADTYA